MHKATGHNFRCNAYYMYVVEAHTATRDSLIEVHMLAFGYRYYICVILNDTYNITRFSCK